MAPFLRPSRRRVALVLAVAACGPFVLAARIWLLKVLIDNVLRGHRPGLLPAVVGAFVGLAVVRAGLDAWKSRLSGGLGTQIVHDLRSECYRTLQGRSLRYFHGQRLGDLLTRLSLDIAAIEDLLVTGATVIVSNTVTLALFLALLVLLNPGLVLIAGAIVPVVAVITVLDSRRGRRVQREVREHTSELASITEEGLSAIALVKAFARAGYERRRFEQASQRSADSRLSMVRVRAVFPPLAELVVGTGTAVVVWIGAGQVLAGRLSLGSLVVFISYLASLYAPIQGLGRVASSVQRAMVGAERVVELLDAPAGASERRGPTLPPVGGRVEFREVTFGYVPDRPVLRDVSFVISPGEMVALIGASGAGKTTLVSLLLSYYDPDRGELTLDGHPLRAFDPDSCRRQVGAVLQEPMLFDTSIRENIRYGRLEASDADIERAAAVAQADQFIRALPDGYETVVGPRGARLSGGQRQRVAIARALVKRAPVLLLDEPTSALDPAIEAQVLAGLRDHCPDTAILVIAHRFSTVSCADRVLMLDGGRLVADGTRTQLMASEPSFRRFAQSQAAASLLMS